MFFKKAEATASEIAERALSTFETARTDLARAIDLLHSEELDHRAAAIEHNAIADDVAAEREQHERVHGKISELLS